MLLLLHMRQYDTKGSIYGRNHASASAPCKFATSCVDHVRTCSAALELSLSRLSACCDCTAATDPLSRLLRYSLAVFSMTGMKRKAATARHSLPDAAPSNKRLPQPPSTPAATNKRSTRTSTTTSALDTRPIKPLKTQDAPLPATRRDERKEAEEDGGIDAAFTTLCSLATSLATVQSQTSSSDRAANNNHYQSILSALHRLPPPAILSSQQPPPAAVLPAVHSAADQFISIARSLQTVVPSSSLLQSQLQQLLSTTLPLSSADTYAILLSASVVLSQLLARSHASSSQIQVRA